jgi:hypothetical protein
MEERTFLIIPVSELSKVDFTQILETSTETVRKSVDGTKTFIKWEVETPTFINELLGIEGPYTYSEMIDILMSEEWSGHNSFDVE